MSEASMTSVRRILTRGAVLVGAVSIAALAATTTALGQDGGLVPQADFSLTVALSESSTGMPVLAGDGRMAIAVSQTVRVFNDAGPGSFLHFAVGNCASHQVIDVGANSVEITGFCSYRDADGDQVFERFATEGAVPLDAIVLTGSWIGGTGKYESLEGDVTTELAGAVQEGDLVLVGGRKTGAYAIASAVPPPAAEPPPAAAGAADAEAVLAALVAEGDEIFHSVGCSGCHGANGQGGAGPELAGNSALSSAAHVISMVLYGNQEHGMPAFVDRLNDRQVAAVGTYIRNSWGNGFGLVRESAVATRR
jgi:mono/diheme cytochrome c family protein